MRYKSPKITNNLKLTVLSKITSQFGTLGYRPVAIIKIWNPKTEKRKVPKLFSWNYFWKLFRKPKLHFQKKEHFDGIGS